MASSNTQAPFKPALLVVDMQEDFCPPNGSLAVAGGRDIAPVINTLLSMPFALKIATKDFHPQNHISFHTSHSPPNNRPFESAVNIHDPGNESQTYEIPLWPVHCVQGTKGAEIIPEIDVSKFDMIVEKGRDKRLEMFSAFADVFGNKSSDAASVDLADTLKDAGITHVFVVGLAGDYCVRCTAIDAKNEGFEICVIEDVTKSVNAGEKGWGASKKDLEMKGITIIRSDGPDVERVKGLP